MILTLIGLSLSFMGSAMLVYETWKNLGKSGPVYFQPNEKYGWKAEKLEPQSDGFLKRVTYTKEERKLIISLSLLSFGFLLQILDFF